MCFPSPPRTGHGPNSASLCFFTFLLSPASEFLVLRAGLAQKMYFSLHVALHEGTEKTLATNNTLLVVGVMMASFSQSQG